ncbi:signal transduction histidine kinase [Variovorax sp. GrIS 2.14]
MRDLRSRWNLYAVNVAFPVLCLLVIVWGFASDGSGLSNKPDEGVYWSASQYQIQFGKLREELLQIVAAQDDSAASVAPPDMKELQQRANNLSSRTKRLIDPSPLHESLRSVSGFDERAAAIAAFDAQIRQSMKRDVLMRSDALNLLKAFSAMDGTVEGFANAARQREEYDRTEQIEQLRQRRWFTFAVTVFLLGWLGSIIKKRRSDQRRATELEAALAAEGQAKTALKESNNTRARFLSMVSHELRSPLQVIVSSVDLLELGTPEFARRTAVARIRRASLMLGVQLRDLLTIARGESGRYEGNPESFEATAFVKDVAEVAAHAAGEKGLKFTMNLPAHPVFARADVQRISQVLANLVSNALRYTQVGEVSLELVEPDTPTGLMVFVIADTGPGLPQAGVERLHTPLTRDEQLRPREDGSGVGLTVVRTVLSHLAAEIQVDVREGDGTRFTVTIPVVYEDANELPSDATPDGPVLLVDDRPDVSASIAALVEGYGHPCEVARSAGEAAELLARHTFETAFFDLDLAGSDGVQLAEQIRREAGPNQNTYIVAITASRQRIPPDLFDEVLIKPVENLRVWWHLAHQSRGRTRVVAIGPVSPPSAP